MDDEAIVRRIGSLADEERNLEQSITAQGGSEDAERLIELEVALDQCWDLLRQRRARREAGQDPDGATPRSTSTVEGYEQ